jgi:hypothetical protein
MTKNEALMEKAIKEAMGKEVIIREIRGKFVVTDKPEFKNRVLSKKQNQVTNFMTYANKLVKGIISNESLRNAAQLRLNVTRERLYTALISEYWKNFWGTDETKQEEYEKELEKYVEEQELSKKNGQ